ncbi:hypothetical protein Pd630_LPD04848 [Rhodococcus opacus PD630]|nr:hypothetical protein Pd630_LPD04848 [Rhodococcus opacus PD630]
MRIRRNDPPMLLCHGMFGSRSELFRGIGPGDELLAGHCR